MIESSYRLSETRSDWQTREGFTFVSDVAFQVIDELAQTTPQKVERIETLMAQACATAEGVSDSAKSLFIVSQSLKHSVPRFQKILSGDYGVSDQDMEQGNRFAYAAGIGEISFPWHFAPALASSMAAEMVEAGYMQQDQVDAWTLHDWADIIGSGWFSRATHMLAYTKNGIYRGFGTSVHDFKKDTFRYLLDSAHIQLPEGDTVFDISERIDPQYDTTHVVAQPNKEVVRALRMELEEGPRGSSAGCPVARFSTMILAEMVEADPHTQNLIAKGKAEVVADRSSDADVMLRLEWSPIDAALAVMAQQLDTYQNLYGQPVPPTNPSSHYDYKLRHSYA